MTENNDDYFLHENVSTTSLYSLDNDIEKQFLKDKINSLEIEIKELKKEVEYYKSFVPIGIVIDTISKYYEQKYSFEEICELSPNINKNLIKEIIMNNKKTIEQTKQ